MERKESEVVENKQTPPVGESEPKVKKLKKNLKRIGIFILNLLPSVGDREEMEDPKKLQESLEFGAFNIVQLIIPVSLCMILVVAFELSIAAHMTVTSSRKIIYGVLAETSSDSGRVVLIGLINALVFICLIIISTVILLLLFKYKCTKAIFLWLVVSSGLLVFFAASTYFVEILKVGNLVIDWVTFVFCVWNYGSLGLMVIHWKGPLRVQQAYLIMNSSIVAIILIRFLPEWSTWLILALLSVYDIVAVLCPKGPLRILIDLAKERGELNLPSLIYSSTMVWILNMADVNKKGNGDKKKIDSDGPSTSYAQHNNSNLHRESEQKISFSKTHLEKNASLPNDLDGKRERKKSADQKSSEGSVEELIDEKRGFKIGLGDLVFYSVLVGRAADVSHGNWVIIVSCFMAILMGLCVTSIILGIVRRALPALPISIFIGLAFYFSSQYMIAPYIEFLNVNNLFI